MSLKRAFEKLDCESGTLASGNLPPSCKPMPALPVSTGGGCAEPRCLRLATCDGNARAWELPWVTFHGASFTAASSSPAPADAQSESIPHDCIELSFARYEVVLRGKHLVKLMDGLHAMNLSEVRTVDEKFLRMSGNDGEPAVVAIEVRKATH